MNRRKKLIEVALPLKEINTQSAREKSIRHGHPSTLHLWWARRPLAACRAVLFAQLVDDPSSDPAYRRPDGSVDEDRAGLKRAELFNLIEDLVKWENSNNPEVINKARAEIARCVASRKIELGELKKETIIYGREEGKEHPDGPLPNDRRYTAWQICCSMAPPEAVNHFLEKYAPPVLDPFAGGGSIPLEAQRLGLRTHASDLNPVPVLINKALIEIPPKFAGLPPVNPAWNADVSSALFDKEWQGAKGLAEDVRYYGQWMRDEAEKRIGHLYPRVKITQEMVDDDRPDLKPYLGQELTVIAWLWGRTVASPDPSVGGKYVPLVTSFWLSKKKGKEAYLMPIIEHGTRTYTFKVKLGNPEGSLLQTVNTGTKLARGAKFKCILSGAPIVPDYVKEEGMAGRLGTQLLAIICEGERGRIYISPTREIEKVAEIPKPAPFEIEQPIADDKRALWCPLYGLTQFADLFTPRQLTALTTFSDLVKEARQKVLEDAKKAWNAGVSPAQCGQDARDPYHNRGYLPHFDQPGLIQHIVFRLHDSVPATVIEQWKEELNWRENLPADDERVIELHKKIAAYEDAGKGVCWLKDPRLADIVQNALLHFNGTRYRLLSWCVMPNHVHVLIETMPEFPVSEIVHSWKSFTAKECNKLLGRNGQFWMQEYFDRFVRSEKQYRYLVDYIANNPVKAGLVKSPDEWKWYGTQASRLQNAGRKTHGMQASGLQGEENAGGTPALHAQAYADAVATYLGFSLSKGANLWSSISSWMNDRGALRETFARQAIPMVWDYAEANPFSSSGGNLAMYIDRIADSIEHTPATIYGIANQDDATSSTLYANQIICTDPPYYDNIGYADLSDFFYVWLRRSLREVYPDLLSTMLTPKAEELIASPYRHGGNKKKAAEFFETGLGQAIQRWRENGHPDYPTTIFYAFKQAETDTAGTASTGWETFLTGVIDAGFTITATWPMRTESPGRSIAQGTNALASSVVLACVPRSPDSHLATRREFITALKQELAEALRLLQSGSIAPVDLAQAAIGPGMAIFSRYAKVVESDGSPMTVRTALTLINQVLDEVLAEQEGEFDSDTRWAVAWFEQFGMEEGPFGMAETLSKAKNTSVEGLVEAGVVVSRGGKVKLLGHGTYGAQASRLQNAGKENAGKMPALHARLTEWESVQHLIRALDKQGETGAADLLRKLGSDYGERARDLAYRLYAICERKGWSGEALAYNSLVIAWPEISKLARRQGTSVRSQGNLFENSEEN